MKTKLSIKQKKIIAIVLIILAAVNLSYQYSSYTALQEHTLIKGQDFAIKNTDSIKKDIDKLLLSIEKETEKTITAIATTNRYSEYKISKICKIQAKKIPEVLGVTISFEPYQFSKNDSLFSIFYDKKQDKLMRIDTMYNYTDTVLRNAKWYTDVITQKKAYWTTPYFGSGANNLITDYSAPLIRNNKIIGVVTYTMSINELMNIMHEFSLGKGGYGFLINTNGTIITHPNPEFILKKNIYKILNNDLVLDEVFGNKNGFVKEYINPTGNVISFAYELLDNKEWKLITVFSPIDLFENNKEIKEKLINLFLSASIVLLIFLFIVIIPKGITSHEAWFFSFSITFILIANIGFIWYLNLNNKYESYENKSVDIRSKTDLNSFTSLQNSKRRQFGFDPLIEIPTAIIVEKIKYVDSYNIGISGWIWQKYPKDCEIEPQVYFPQVSPFAEANYLNKFSTEEKEDYNLIKWQFRSTFIFNFNYLKYPFNTKTLNLKLTHPDFDKNILFTPDISAYATLNPSKLPGLSIDSKTSSSSYISSKFTFIEHKLSGNFDSKTIGKLQGIPILQFEIKTRKPFLNALIKQFIPITLVSLMIYLLLFSVRTNSKKGRQTVGIETIAGFLFILVLSHIDFRKTVFSGSLTYLESFYFVIYFMIAFISINIILFNLSREYFMIKNSNKLLKLSYWPFFFFTILAITLAVFY
jgi:hypothetical protein